MDDEKKKIGTWSSIVDVSRPGSHMDIVDELIRRAQNRRDKAIQLSKDHKYADAMYWDSVAVGIEQVAIWVREWDRHGIGSDRSDQKKKDQPACSVPVCDICGKVQTELGGIEFGPPRSFEGESGM